ncbi:bifunctional serine/threonine-protein kinase/formylglycine-generating enzyme family protein [Okeania sp. SIO1I7]|uniref:bifunctional serine/threonine-protein kinase/formylglycine-generating enzyme family protein n=1 Tax=Okeania sp. SIO1I7 TaxID=2607772 RepID=UPI0013FB587E|nr:bifunctional serine/threonine-protein kinase/formylglycine-generating enzyme family protein [Okeania sp. SIO1I7]NET27211.1 SUMF1/EgtB/PvdO family nonheme iron enzyme [Okeania sp. SIO1I7]
MQSGKILRQRYKIIGSPLGSGGFGDTYLAQDLDLPENPKCVVKHLKPKSSDPGILPVAQKLFEREAKTLYKLGKDSDQIPKLFAHFQEGTEFYLVQEYIEGQDISKELTEGKKLSQSYTITLLKGILEALAVAHQNNIVHRDIKPQNLMRRKSDNKIVLIDFGAVKEISVLTTANQPGATTFTVAVGTPGYMPSEQTRGQPKLSSDIYAVGMVGIKALTGKNPEDLPRDSKTEHIIWRNEARVSDRLANILDRMVHEYFLLRYENAMGVLEALDIPTSPVPTPQPTPAPTPSQTKTVVPKLQPQPNKTRRQILTLGGLAGGGFVAAMLTKNLWSRTPPENISTSQAIPEPTPENISSPEPILEPPPPPQPEFPIQIFTTVKVNRTGEIISSREGKAEVMTENFNGVSLEMVKIPAGRFLMGSPETEAKRSDWESPQHNVDVPEFFMGKYPVTQAQWQAVMGNNTSSFKGANRPVENVSWNDATEFCQKLSQITGKKYSLPSESQWEYACRARTSTPFYFGETITSELANYRGSSTYADEPPGIYRDKTTDVGIFPPNAFGLYDMHGNLLEWCQDVWHSNYNGLPINGSAWETGGDSNRRVLRGGCWFFYSWYCRSAGRYYDSTDDRNYDRGFRVVSSVSRS